MTIKSRALACSPVSACHRLGLIFIVPVVVAMLSCNAAIADSKLASTAGTSRTLALGFFVNDPKLGDGALDPATMDNFAKLVAAKPAAWHWYTGFASLFQRETFDAAAARGYMPVLSWGPSDANWNSVSWDSVAKGNVDPLVYAFARSAKAWGKPFYLRPAWEMNLYFDGKKNTPDSFVRMWKHLHDIFVLEDARNARWFWCPNEEGETPQTPYASYYPGDAYVDYIGFDAYNWGTTQPWSYWRSPADTYGPAYRGITKVSSKKPLIIAETGSTELGGNKAEWIRQAYLVDVPQKFPRIIGVLYFSNNQDGSDWSVDSSQSSLQAFKTVMHSPIIRQGRLP